ncbi:DUF5980 family protein [Actinophytocola sediminis]
MRSSFRAGTLVAGLVSALVLTLAGSSAYASADVSARSAGPTWEIHHPGDPQRMCTNPGSGFTHSYFLLVVKGTWSTNVDYGIRNLPSGSTGTSYHIPPGSNYPQPDGAILVNGFIQVAVHTNNPVGTYNAEIWASDGTVTQTEPVEIVISTDDWVDCMSSR